MGERPLGWTESRGSVPDLGGRDGGKPLELLFDGRLVMSGVRDDEDGPAEYRLGLGEFAADLEWLRVNGPALSGAPGPRPRPESRLDEDEAFPPGGAGAARVGSICDEEGSNAFEEGTGGDRNDEGARPLRSVNVGL